MLLPTPGRTQGWAQFALFQKGVNVVEILGQQHHCQYGAVCNILIEQPNYWLEEEVLEGREGREGNSAVVAASYGKV
jgi:hypothetical protein